MPYGGLWEICNQNKLMSLMLNLCDSLQPPLWDLHILCWFFLLKNTQPGRTHYPLFNKVSESFAYLFSFARPPSPIFSQCLTLVSSIIFTLISTVCHSFMFGLLMKGQSTLPSSFIFTLITIVCHSFMVWLLMKGQNTLPSSFIFTLITTVFYSFMFKPLM